MARKIVSTCVLVASLAVVTPALAQTPAWSVDRPDGHAPSGVTADYSLEKGDVYFGYRYYRTDFDGTLVGTTPFFSDEVLDFFTVSPLSMQRQSHEMELRFGLSDAVSLSLAMPFVMNAMWNVTEDDEFFQTESNDIGDLRVRLLMDLFEFDQYRMHLMLGGTAPTGEIGDADQTPLSGTGTDVLPFPMQTGSGTVDILAGLGFSVQNAMASVGTQANLTVRAFDNSQDYRLGDAFEFTVWGAYNINDWMSVSARALYESVGETEGIDTRTDGEADPSANPFAQGGERVYLPFGVNLQFREGALSGHRIAVEWYYPVHQEVKSRVVCKSERKLLDASVRLPWRPPSVREA